MNRKINTEI